MRNYIPPCPGIHGGVFLVVRPSLSERKLQRGLDLLCSLRDRDSCTEGTHELQGAFTAINQSLREHKSYTKNLAHQDSNEKDYQINKVSARGRDRGR